MLCSVGDLVEDVVVWPAAPPRRGTDTPARVFRRRGGSAANVAVFAAAAGGNSRFIGQVGEDRLGHLLVAELADAGVEPAVIHEGRTGTIVVLIEADGERTMLPDRGAATQLSEIPPRALDDAAWIHVPGYSLMVEPLGTTALEIVETAGRSGSAVSIDASSVDVLETYGVPEFTKLLEQIRPEVLFCNKEEAAVLGVAPGSPPPGTVLSVVKAGPEPVGLVTDHSTTWVPVPAVENVADTTGAGDAFAAGFLVATMEGAKPIKATQAGIDLAAKLLLQPGAEVSGT